MLFKPAVINSPMVLTVNTPSSRTILPVNPATRHPMIGTMINASNVCNFFVIMSTSMMTIGKYANEC